MSATNLAILVGQAKALATQLGNASELDTTEMNISCDTNVYGPNGVFLNVQTSIVMLVMFQLYLVR